jgi:hypothetical protein
MLLTESVVFLGRFHSCIIILYKNDTEAWSVEMSTSLNVDYFIGWSLRKPFWIEHFELMSAELKLFFI